MRLYGPPEIKVGLPQTAGRGHMVDPRGEVRRGVVLEPVGPVQRPGKAAGRHEDCLETRRKNRRRAGIAV